MTDSKLGITRCRFRFKKSIYINNYYFLDGELEDWGLSCQNMKIIPPYYFKTVQNTM